MIERTDSALSPRRTVVRGLSVFRRPAQRGRFGCRALPRIAALLAAGMACLIAALNDPPASAAEQTVQDAEEQLEYNIKLAYICNLGRYVVWPADAMPKDNDTLVIGVLGEDPFQGTFDEIAAKRKVQGRTIAVRHFASLKEYQPCHILFMSKIVPLEEQESAIRELRGKPVLLVGEVPEFAARGGCVNFYRDGENVRLEINPDAVQGQQLQVSAKLLSLAKIVKRS